MRNNSSESENNTLDFDFALNSQKKTKLFLFLEKIPVEAL